MWWLIISSIIFLTLMKQPGSLREAKILPCCSAVAELREGAESPILIFQRPWMHQELPPNHHANFLQRPRGKGRRDTEVVW